MTSDAHFFDTYAIIETIKANENYLPYISSTPVLTQLNLFELYYTLLREFNSEIASTFLLKYSPFAIDFDNKTIEEAAQFRLKYKKNHLSMTDCVGYISACRLGVPFLTGDKEFSNFPNVAFVK